MNFEKIQKEFMNKVMSFSIEELERINRSLHELTEREEVFDLLYNDDSETEFGLCLDTLELVISRALLLRLIERKERGTT